MGQIWFECKVRFMKTDQDGRERMVTETYMINGISYTDAEATIIMKMQQLVRGEFMIVNIRKSSVGGIFIYDKGEWWYKAGINVVLIDDESGSEKNARGYYLINGDNIREALSRLEERLAILAVPYVISSLAVTMVADVFTHETQGMPVPDNDRSFDDLLAERRQAENNL